MSSKKKQRSAKIIRTLSEPDARRAAIGALARGDDSAGVVQELKKLKLSSAERAARPVSSSVLCSTGGGGMKV